MAAPTAPPGRICIYLISSGNVSGITGGHLSSVALYSRTGFDIGMETTSSSPTAYGTWAYTAP